MKDEKGITIIVLAITVIVMLIILGITISSGGDSLETAELQAFVADCEIIQSKVDVISEKARIDSTYLETIGIADKTKWNNESLKQKLNISNLTHQVQATFTVREEPSEGQDKVTVKIELTNEDDVLYNEYYWENGKIQE